MKPLIVSDVVGVSDESKSLIDHELKEIEECGGGYLSNDDDDVNSLFTIDGNGDKQLIK